MVAAVAVAAGVWLVVGAIWPAPRSLSGALGRLHAPGRPQHEPSDAAGDRGVTHVVGRWVLRGARRWLLADEAMLADLAILHRPPELVAGVTALAVIGGALAGPVAWALAGVAGTPLPWLVPVWVVVAGAVIGYVVPRLITRSQAASARRD